MVVRPGGIRAGRAGGCRLPFRSFVFIGRPFFTRFFSSCTFRSLLLLLSLALQLVAVSLPPNLASHLSNSLLPVLAFTITVGERDVDVSDILNIPDSPVKAAVRCLS